MKKSFLTIILLTIGFLFIATRSNNTDNDILLTNELINTCIGDELTVMGQITYIHIEGNFREYIVLDNNVNIYVFDSSKYSKLQHVKIKVKKISELFYMERID
jgi:hypothetical protein